MILTPEELVRVQAQAVAEYAGRMSIEETYRDWHHHWLIIP